MTSSSPLIDVHTHVVPHGLPFGHDDRFAVAVAGGTVSDLVSMGGSSDDCHLLSVHELDGTPWQKPAEYAAMSPLTHVADVRTPTLLLHGAADLTCPVGQAQQRGKRAGAECQPQCADAAEDGIRQKSAAKE